MENDLTNLFSLIELERDGQGGYKQKLIEEIENQKYKLHNFYFWSLVNDLLVLLGEKVSDFLEPVESEEGILVSARIDRFNHVLKRLAQYISNEGGMAQRLFNYKICKIKYLKDYIEVEQILDIPRELALVKEKYGTSYYVEYIFENSFADITEVHKLTEDEIHQYHQGTLDLKSLYSNLVTSWFRRKK